VIDNLYAIIKDIKVDYLVYNLFMPKKINNETENVGNVMYEWTFNEYEKYARGRTWYIVAGIVGVLLLAYALISGVNSFALIIVLFGIVLYLHEIQEPMEMRFAVTDTGVILGNKFYKYSELVSFWIIYYPEEGRPKNLYFALNNAIKHRFHVPLLDYDPRPIRDFLRQFLMEDLEQEEEPLSEKMARLLKIH
jgi:hypothetical protein